MKWLFPLTFSLFFSGKAFAAACCGGSFASPSTITSDDRAQFTSTLTSAETVADARPDGLWRKRETEEIVNTLRLEGAYVFWDRWQAGLGVPIVQRSREDEQSSGLGDVSVSLGYEYLPDWDYNPWRPKGIGYLQATTPTGKSIYESDHLYALDSYGRGFWSLGVGTILTKTVRRFDGFFNGEVHHSFPRKVKDDDLRGTADPGWGISSTLGAGYNAGNFRFGTAVTLNHEDPVDFRGTQTSEGQPQRFATAQFIVSYLVDEHWSTSLSYADQTLIGSPSNSSLSKLVSFQLQRRWTR